MYTPPPRRSDAAARDDAYNRPNNTSARADHRADITQEEPRWT